MIHSAPYERETNTTYGIVCPDCGDWHYKVIEIRFYTDPGRKYIIYECIKCKNNYSTMEIPFTFWANLIPDYTKITEPPVNNIRNEVKKAVDNPVSMFYKSFMQKYFKYLKDKLK